MRVSRKISIYRAQRSQQGCSLSLGMLRLAEPPTGRARLRSSLKSPRNPITPFETSRVATLHPGLYKNLREGANPPDLPPRGRGTARRRWKEFAGGGRSKPPSNPNHMPDMRRVRRAYDFFCFRRIGVGRPNWPNGGKKAQMTCPRPSADGQIVVSSGCEGYAKKRLVSGFCKKNVKPE